MNEHRMQEPTRDAQRPRIMVGVDGSPDSIAALKAAAWAAAARGGVLVAVHAWAAPWLYGEARLVLPEAQRDAERVLEDALDAAFGERALVPVERLVTPEIPAVALVEASRGADLLVVGSRGHGGFGGLLIGSISMACTMRAHCPVLVVHAGGPLTDAQEARSGARVVVGVGPGLGAVQLLRTAAQAAQELDAELLAVTAWQYPGRRPDGRPDLREDLRDAAERVLDRQVDQAFFHGRPAHLRTEVREGTPSAVLVEASRTADLVVVGRIGRSPWAGVLLGSVSLPVAEHAQCPVLVVPGAPEPAEVRAPAHAEAAALGQA